MLLFCNNKFLAACNNMGFDYNTYRKSIFLGGLDFERTAINVFNFQYQNNKVYKEYCDYLKINISGINSVAEIPFIPIDLFKTHKIVSNNDPIQTIFTSSSTTGNIPSKHYITDAGIYVDSFLNGFKYFYGDTEEYSILGLLPSYLEREGSSLIYMVNELIKLSKNGYSGFFLNNLSSLYDTIKKLEEKSKKYILIGVSFALLEFSERYELDIHNGIVMETGGMKGRRKEIIRKELHEILKRKFNITEVHSEYGMTELLSQAYSYGRGIFRCPPWMKILVREVEDPLVVKLKGSGGINVIDLANINSCCFIATSDLGEVYSNGSFSISGRFDNSDVRGCNLMISI